MRSYYSFKRCDVICFTERIIQLGPFTVLSPNKNDAKSTDWTVALKSTTAWVIANGDWGFNTADRAGMNIYRHNLQPVKLIVTQSRFKVFLWTWLMIRKLSIFFHFYFHFFQINILHYRVSRFILLHLPFTHTWPLCDIWSLQIQTPSTSLPRPQCVFNLTSIWF